MRTSFRASPQVEKPPSLDCLHSACAQRFPEPAYRIRRDDATSTLWVSADGSRLELGVQPHNGQRRGSSAVFDKMESKFRGC